MRRPAAHGIVRVGAARGEPRLEGVERERDTCAPSAASSVARHRRPRASGSSAARTLRARSRSSSVHCAPPAFAALRATSSTSRSGSAAVAMVRSSSVVPPTGAGVIAWSAAFATAAACSAPARPALPAPSRRTRFFAKSLLEAPERIVAADRLAEALRLLLDAEELADEAAHVRRGGEERLALGDARSSPRPCRRGTRRSARGARATPRRTSGRRARAARASFAGVVAGRRR